MIIKCVIFLRLFAAHFGRLLGEKGGRSVVRSFTALTAPSLDCLYVLFSYELLLPLAFPPLARSHVLVVLRLQGRLLAHPLGGPGRVDLQ